MVGSQMAIAKALADFNLAVRYRIAIRIIIIGEQEILANFNLAVVKLDRQTAKFSGYMVILYYGTFHKIILKSGNWRTVWRHCAQLHTHSSYMTLIGVHEMHG